ncbi:PepSY domain-containing protein [Leptolyngbya sp. FACHB-261]|uniref:PepSY-associated TM helix domain-containing protein n=1 Tax=Leptolyngbya sp. FACHB-261 TaxID=2692806 RepID=UPI001688C0C1|nr:PepSY domain-containing protein [Leptolyngbya sp. FACHB-261]MBD2101516.1 PepSY domain-containing protein [Leptolyngbya sp. FACHB-261]
MPTKPDQLVSASYFYRVVWRWHFYAGLLVAPFMVMLAITGSIYLFKPQLDGWMYHNLMFVPPTSPALSQVEQLEAVRSAYPGAELSTFRPAETPERSAEVGLTTQDGRELTVFVNPANGNLLGNRDETHNLQAYARKLHGELMLGVIGDRMIELAACWGLVLMITGLYLWWPRKGSLLWGTLLPRLNSQDRRVFWRDLHVVPGFYGSLLVVFMILTGLPWSGFWGEQFANIWSRYPAQVLDNFPKSTLLTGSLNQSGDKRVPWAVEKLPIPQSDSSGHEAHQGLMQHPTSNSVVAPDGIPSGTPVNLDSVVALAQAKGVPAGFKVSLPTDPEGVYTVSAAPNNPAEQVTLHIDQYSGKVLNEVRWAQYGVVPRAVELGIAVHEGRYFGLLNQLLMLFTCLVVIGLSLTGLVMWWQRRPLGQLGAPPMPKNLPLWKQAVVIIAILGVLFPLVGLSLLAVLLLDYLVISRIPFLKRALG